MMSGQAGNSHGRAAFPERSDPPARAASAWARSA